MSGLSALITPTGPSIKNSDLCQEFPKLWFFQYFCVSLAQISYHKPQIPNISTIRPRSLKQNIRFTKLLRLNIISVRNRTISKNRSTEVADFDLSHPLL